MKFRLKMDLSEFYDDERNLAYILVDPQWKQVVRLQQHVQELFDVPQVQFLTSDGIYIPPLECIDVIKSNDVLKAIIPLKSKKKKKKSKLSSQAFAGQSEDDSLEINGDKRKMNDEEKLHCSTPNIRPSKIQKISNKPESIINSLIIQDCSMKELEESKLGGQQNSNTVSSTIDSKELDSSIADGEVFTQPEDTIKSHKRKRSRKNKKSTEDKEKDSRLSSVPVPISSSTLRLSKSMSTPNHSSVKHVHFSNGADDDGVTLVEEKPSDRIVFRSLLSIDCEARVIEAESKETGKHEKKPVIQIQEDIVLVPATDELPKNSTAIVDDQDDCYCSVIEVDDSVAKSDSDENNSQIANGNDDYKDICVEKILPLSEELSEMPNVGDIILFKIYQLTEALTPQITEYICGQCKEVDLVNKTLNCVILDGLDQLDEHQTMITPSDDNNIKRKGNLNCFRFFFNEMLDKRVFRM